MFNDEDIVALDNLDLIEVASECRRDPELRERVKRYIKKTGVAKVIKEVIEKSGAQCTDSSAVAEAVFAYGAIALTVMAVSALAKMRDDMVRSGHPDCADGSPCPTTHRQCERIDCPFFKGIHPIKHMDAIETATKLDAINFANGMGEA
jgi:hypothetical protein